MFTPVKPIFCNFSEINQALTEQYSNLGFLKVNLENLGLTWFELVKMIGI